MPPTRLANGRSRVRAKNARPKRRSARCCSRIPAGCATACATTSTHSLPTSTHWKIPERTRSSSCSPHARHRCRRRARCCARLRATSPTRCPNPTATRRPARHRNGRRRSLYSSGTTPTPRPSRSERSPPTTVTGHPYNALGTICAEVSCSSPRDLDQLPQNAERDAAGRREQHERQAVYVEWREEAARQLARNAGPLGRLTHRPDDFYPQLDQ